MRLCLAAASLLVGRGAAQGPGNGISKSTWACSHPLNLTYPWLMKYLPVTDADDSCKNNICECGATGRVTLKAGPDEQPGGGFGIHTVLAAGIKGSRAHASGNLSVAQVEAIFNGKVAPAIAAGRTDPWMDYHLALFVPDLSEYTTPFKADSVPYLPLTFNASNGKSYASLYVYIPHTQVVFLLVAADKGGDRDEHWTVGSAGFKGYAPELLDFSGYGGEAPYVPSGLAKPLHESRAVSNVSTLVDFYKTVFEVDPTHSSAIAGGGKLITFVLPSSEVAIRYVQRPQGTDGGKDGRSTAWWQTFLNDVAAEYQTSYKSCWPIWGDNHYCYDSGTQTTDQLVAKYEAHKGEPGYVYHPFKNPGGNGCNAYFGEPSGWQFQYDGIYEECPADAEEFSPNYCYAGCEKPD